MGLNDTALNTLIFVKQEKEREKKADDASQAPLPIEEKIVNQVQ